MDDWFAKYPCGLTFADKALAVFYPLYLQALDRFWGPYVSNGKLKWMETEWTTTKKPCRDF